MFYVFAMLRAYNFLYLAIKWKDIMRFWYMKEKPLLSGPYTMRGFSLSLKVYLIGFVFFIFYLSEHLLFIGMELHINRKQMTTCNVTNLSFLNNYLRRQRPHVVDILTYRWWIFPFLQFTITLMAFGWNFVDYFIIILSLALSTRFSALNTRLETTPPYQMKHKFWNDIRIHYMNLVELVYYVDKKISFLMLVCISHNLFLICTKISESIK